MVSYEEWVRNNSTIQCKICGNSRFVKEPECAGRGQTECEICWGTGEDVDYNECDWCLGKGKMECTEPGCVNGMILCECSLHLDRESYKKRTELEKEAIKRFDNKPEQVNPAV